MVDMNNEAIRHTMTVKELNELYKQLEKFIADCPRTEYEENKNAFKKVQTAIHQRIRLITKQ